MEYKGRKIAPVRSSAERVWIRFIDNNEVATQYVEANLAREIAKRWNAYEDLMAALIELKDDAFNVSANGDRDIADALESSIETAHATIEKHK